MSKRKREPIASAPPAASAPAEARDHSPVTRAELVALGVILAVGIGLRWLLLNRAAIEHFDEGVYASKVFFGPDGAWPMQHLYAPPLLPLLIENLMLMVGITNLAALLPGLILGSATILLVWWMGRTWFGPSAGLGAAMLAATSEVHAFFSRAALTDVPLTCFLLAAVFAWERSLTRRSLAWAVGAGVLTGLAGLTKYNGWLPIGVAGCALVLGLGMRLWRPISRQDPEVPLSKAAISIAIMLLAAFAIWTPYLWQLQSQGGYAAVAANHAKYVVGLSGWPGSAARQIANHLFLESWVTCLGLGAAWLLSRRSPRESWLAPRLLGESLLLAAIAGWIGAMAVLLTGGVLFVAQAVRRPTSLGQIVVVAGWLMLLAMTPLYYPYARLTLPWLTLAWLAAGALATPVEEAISATTKPKSGRRWLLAGIVAVTGTGILAPRFVRLPTPWQPRTEMQSAAQQFAQVIREQQAQDDQTQPREPAIFVFGEPALVFHLRSLGFDIVTPVQEPAPRMKNANIPTARVWLILGPQGERDPAYARRWPEFRDIWQLRDTARSEISDLMLLDLFNPREFSWNHPPREVELRLYSWRPEE